MCQSVVMELTVYSRDKQYIKVNMFTCVVVCMHIDQNRYIVGKSCCECELIFNNI